MSGVSDSLAWGIRWETVERLDGTPLSGALMRETDIRMLKDDLENGVRLARSLGIDVSGIELPY